MTPSDALALFAAMLVLAALPSSSVLTVTARSAALGLRHGALTAAGVVAGDCVLILVAMLGLGVLVQALGPGLWLLQAGATLWLVWLACALWRSSAATDAPAAGGLSSFMAGLMLTLADHKALLFYLGFLPAFVDLASLDVLDVGVVMLIALVAVGGVKLAYAVAAARAGALLHGRGAAWLRRAGALVLFAVALMLVAGAVQTLMESSA